MTSEAPAASRALTSIGPIPAASVIDRFARPLRDLRISVTDRCMFRCVYCMPREVYGPDHAFLPHADLLSFDEIERLVRLFVRHGVAKVRLTGGEPLMRRELEELVARLANIEGIRDLALTTNGALLARRAAALAEAGLRRVTVSLDALDEGIFATMNGVGYSARRVLDAIEAAAAVGLSVKVNAVIKRGVNDDQVVDLARRFRGSGHILRFIEYMDVGHSNGWRLNEVVPVATIVGRIDAEFPLEPIAPAYRGEVARRYRYRDGAGEIGLIASVSRPFCGECTRARLSADGVLYTCLFAATGHDLRGPMRDGATDRELDAFIISVWRSRDDRYSELRSAATADLPKVEMSYIGG